MPLGILILSFLCFTSYSYSEPFTPTEDSYVVETMPVVLSVKKSSSATMASKTQPLNLDEALDFASKTVTAAERDGDLRYYGYAEKLLTPFIDVDAGKPSVKALIKRAYLRQHMHNFSGALDDLNSALKISPQDSQALFSKALILLTQGDIKNAKKTCARLFLNTDQLILGLCSVATSSLGENGDKGYRTVSALLQESQNTDSLLQSWGYTLKGDIAQGLEYEKEAEDSYKKAIELNRNNTTALASYGDLLLKQSRFQDAVNILSDHKEKLALLLRLTIAKKYLKSEDYNDQLSNLKGILQVAELRGEDGDAREKAIFYLRIMGDGKKALEYSQKNWQLQREAIDAQIFLESAILANQPKSADSVILFAKENRVENKGILNLIEKLNVP